MERAGSARIGARGSGQLRGPQPKTDTHLSVPPYLAETNTTRSSHELSDVMGAGDDEPARSRAAPFPRPPTGCPSTPAGGRAVSAARALMRGVKSSPGSGASTHPVGFPQIQHRHAVQGSGNVQVAVDGGALVAEENTCTSSGTRARQMCDAAASGRVSKRAPAPYPAQEPPTRGQRRSSRRSACYQGPTATRTASPRGPENPTPEPCQRVSSSAIRSPRTRPSTRARHIASRREKPSSRSQAPHRKARGTAGCPNTHENRTSGVKSGYCHVGKNTRETGRAASGGEVPPAGGGVGSGTSAMLAMLSPLDLSLACSVREWMKGDPGCGPLSNSVSMTSLMVRTTAAARPAVTGANRRQQRP